MATSDFQPEPFDTDFRLVIVTQWCGGQRHEVSCFEFYGPAVEAWLDVDDQVRAGKLKLVDWQLVDPNGRELLSSRVHYTRDTDHAAGLEPGVYTFDEATDSLVPFVQGAGD